MNKSQVPRAADVTAMAEQNVQQEHWGACRNNPSVCPCRHRPPFDALDRLRQDDKGAGLKLVLGIPKMFANYDLRVSAAANRNIIA